jgi:hypothetical protein
VDIESKIEFFFHWCVCLFELFKLQPRKLSGLVRLCSLTGSSRRKNMNGKHTHLFNPVLARSLPVRSHKV